jgi:RimJ/RimL family protein N-acetyltransferase
MAGEVPVLATGRLELRPLRPSDAGLIGLYASDARVARMTTSIPHPYPPGAAGAFVAASLSGRRAERTWVMDATPADGAELVGLISVRPAGDGAEEVGYWVGPPFWNTGYASEALAAIVRHRLAAGVRKLSAHVFDDNPVSARVLVRAGFRPDGARAAHSVARGGMVDGRTYVLDRRTDG